MATTSLSSVHRSDLIELTTFAQGDLKGMWRDFGNPAQARDMLMRSLPRLVALYGAAAATLGADYYDEARDAAGARGRFRAAPAEVDVDEELDVLARVAVGSLFGAKPDLLAALTIASGGLQRHIANADRETVRAASIADDGAQGWRRVGSGTSCSFCSMLLGRGAVYRESSASFDAHDHCNCTAAPAF